MKYPKLEPKVLNVHDAKTHFSRYLSRVEQGETIVLCRRNVPIAELRPLPQRRRTKRPIGLGAGEFTVGPEFDEPLSEELLVAFGAGPASD